MSGRWIGPLTPAATTPATAAQLCAPTRGVLQINGKNVIFTPSEGTWVLRGSIDSQGTITAEHSQIGANKQPYETTLTATWSPGPITGTYTTPRCKFDVTLARNR